MTPRDSFPPYEHDRVEPGASYVFHQPLATSWRESLSVIPLLFAGAGLVMWLNHQATRQQARVEVSEAVKAVGQPPGLPGLPAIEPDAIGTSGSAAVGTAGAFKSRSERTLPGGTMVATPSGSAEDRLSAFLDSSRTGQTSITLDRLRFHTGSARLTAPSLEQVDNIAKILRAYPNTRVTIAGYADNTGREPANVRLSQARAKAVSERLTHDGVASGRVQAQGFGSQKPIGDNSTETGRRQNRRVELEVDVQR